MSNARFFVTRAILRRVEAIDERVKNMGEDPGPFAYKRVRAAWLEEGERLRAERAALKSYIAEHLREES